MRKYIFFCIVVWILAGCAAQAPPGGGPEDKTPPELIAVEPSWESTRVPVNQSIVLTFSESLNPTSVRASFMLFPLNTTETRIKIRRNRVRVFPVDHWEDSTVYTLVFNRSIQDLRGNHLEEGIFYTFTTGEKIPEGVIFGRVPNFRKKDRILIGLAFGEWRPDSLFSHLSYLTETDHEGFYRFQAIPPGLYTLSGIVDHDQSKSYSPGFDDLVLPETLHIAMEDSAVRRIDLGVVRGNFVPMKYVSGKNLYPTVTELKFTKVPSSQTMKNAFVVNDFPVDTFQILGKDVRLYHRMITDSLYRFHINLLSDTLGVSAGPFSDTLAVRTFTDTLGRVSWQDNCLVLEPPVDMDTLTVMALTPGDTSRRVMRASLPGRFKPDDSWKTKDFNGRLAVTVPLPEAYPTILEWNDTVSVRYIAESDSGRFICHVPEMPYKQVGFILTGKKGRYQKVITTPGTCIFENVFAGEYSLWYYPDRNQNGRQDHGWLWPYRAPEIARPLMDEIQIRARWDTEMDLLFDDE
ncbi:MAG: putative lipoprotein [Marinimicrobia bacterium 46_43]|nr:MAG: putative lipoprotein [Marinimicrobia bacterium 46_43]HBY18096.1 hypothetical protein [Candidatus Neomarinimicrobiota bacterium]